MDGDAVKKLAHRWMREYGCQSEWHLRRKIARLRDWGDDGGADIYQQVLDYCEGGAPVAPGPVRLALRSWWFTGEFRRSLGA